MQMHSPRMREARLPTPASWRCQWRVTRVSRKEHAGRKWRSLHHPYRQIARSIHFISFSWFVLFILAHGIMVFVTGLRENTNHMFAGVESISWAGLLPFLLAMGVVAVAWAVATPLTIRHARLVQHTGKFLVGGPFALSARPGPLFQIAVGIAVRFH